MHTVGKVLGDIKNHNSPVYTLIFHTATEYPGHHQFGGLYFYYQWMEIYCANYKSSSNTNTHRRIIPARCLKNVQTVNNVYVLGNINKFLF